ncbi:MAG: hypothetical protein C4589_10990 [Peptococcaceae bacterium]|nr:MAG: hypothetical protein C4589_10990 [Peptococcaceae bacterium]
MANLKLDDNGRPIPQIQNDAGTDFDAWKGENNAGRVTGDVAHDAVDTGKPVKIGGKAVDPVALPADVAVGDRTNALFDQKGRLFVRQDVASVLPAGAATEAKQDVLNAKDFATQTTLASILAKIIAAPATEAKQDTIIGHVDALETLLTAIKDTAGIKKITDALPAGANILGKVGIDQTTPGTTNRVDIGAALPAGGNNIGKVNIEAALPAGGNNIGNVGVASSVLPTGAATSAKQDVLIAKDFATETTLASVLAKIIAAPATEAKQDIIIGYIDALETLLTAIKDTDGIKRIVDALPAGTNNIGDVDVLTLPATSQEGTALASAARTATMSSPDLSNNHKNGVHVILDVTAITDTPSITLKIEGKDPASGNYYTILEGAAVATVNTNIYKVFPAATAAANAVANDIIPRTWRVTVTHADADSITYSVGYSLI